MDIHEFRQLTPDAKMEMIFSEFLNLRADNSVMREELSHFKELERTRRLLKQRRAKVKNLEVGNAN